MATYLPSQWDDLVLDAGENEALRLALSAGRLGSFALDIATGAMNCTAQCKTNFGLSPDADFSYNDLLALIHPDDRPSMQPAVGDALREHGDYAAEYRILLPGGKMRWIAARGRASYSPDGMPIKMIGITQDITEQRQGEDALRASKEAVAERERRVRALYELTSRTDLDFTEKVQRLLAVGRASLGLEAAILARIDCDAGTFEITQADAVSDGFPVGFSCPLENTFCSRTVRSGMESPSLSVEHAGAHPEWRELPAYAIYGCEAYLGAVIRVGGDVWGTLSFFAFTPRQERFTEFDSDMIRLMAQWVGGEVARRESEAALRATSLQQRRFVREMLMSVTEGKLCLCDHAGDMPEPLTVASEVVDLVPTALRLLRKRVEAVAESLSMPKEKTLDLLTAVGEAGMNAIRHGGGGTGRVYTDPDRGVIQVWIEDQGAGIREEDLHRATLETGWSGAGSLGHGFFLMLRTVDRTFLLTGTGGTTVVLEQECATPPPAWLAALSV